MAAEPCLVLYGNSIFLAGIKADLENRIPFKLIAVEVGCANAVEQIRAHEPVILLFDVTTGQPEFTMLLLRDQPGLLIISLDPSSNEMLVLSARLYQALSMSDLVNVINQQDTSERKRSAQENALSRTRKVERPNLHKQTSAVRAQYHFPGGFWNPLYFFKSRMRKVVSGVLLTVVLAITVSIAAFGSQSGLLLGATTLIITPTDPRVGWRQSLELSVNTKSTCNWFSSSRLITFSSDRTAVTSVMITGKAPGSATIEARCGFFNTSRVSTTVTVVDQPHITPASSVLGLQESQEFSVGDATCQWAVEPATGVLSLGTKSGATNILTGVGVGDATVTVTCQYGVTHAKVLVRQ